MELIEKNSSLDFPPGLDPTVSQKAVGIQHTTELLLDPESQATEQEEETADSLMTRSAT